MTSFLKLHYSFLENGFILFPYLLLRTAVFSGTKHDQAHFMGLLYFAFHDFVTSLESFHLAHYNNLYCETADIKKKEIIRLLINILRARTLFLPLKPPAPIQL